MHTVMKLSTTVLLTAHARQIRANEPKPNPNRNPKPKPNLTPNTKRSLRTQSIAFHIALFTVRVHGEYNYCMVISSDEIKTFL